MELKNLLDNNSPTDATNALPATLVCFSHLRWNFVYQRPQQLLSRLAHTFNIFFIEEPVYGSADAHYEITDDGAGVTVMVPHLPRGLDELSITGMQRSLLDKFLADEKIDSICAWYYTPMALQFSRHLKPAITVFDCMDELSAFKFAPQELKDLEKELLQRADVVFTGGHSLYNAKKATHKNIHPFPSSVDKAHFGKARNMNATPGDQAHIGAPRIGFFGVIDERFDIDLVEQVAIRRPDWHMVLIGPVVKIDPATLPQRDNIHYLGGKSYNELPEYLAGWDIAMIPFLLNESTEFISPTKTPEYLSAGVPVISTPITDVINPYGDNGLVHIVANADEFIEAAISVLYNKTADSEWLQNVDGFLSNLSWDNTVELMIEKIKMVNHITNRN